MARALTLQALLPVGGSDGSKLLIFRSIRIREVELERAFYICAPLDESSQKFRLATSHSCLYRFQTYHLMGSQGQIMRSDK